MQPINTEADVAAGVTALTAADPRLAAVVARAGQVPLRRRPGGFEGLAAIVTAQQVSTASGEAIWARFRAALEPFTPEGFLALDEAAHRAIGLSRPKIRTLTGVAEAFRSGFDIAALHDLPAEAAIAELVRLKGIGPWTAEIYLLFCIGHPDVFPAGDLALQVAVQAGLGLPERPGEKALRAIALPWSPWRGIAARLFWAYYRAEREATKAAGSAQRRKAPAG